MCRIPINNSTLDTEVVALLDYLRNFWKSPNLLLINCEMELNLSQSKNCIISKIFNTPEIDANPVPVPPITHVSATTTTTALLQINRTKRYVPVVTLFLNNNIKLLGNLKQGFKRTISWIKYRSEITVQPKRSNLY